MSPTRQLASALFAQLAGQPLEDWVADARDAGQSWRQIAMRFEATTGVFLTDQTFANWFSHADAA